MLYFTRTGLPSCLPGVQLGIAFITRKASASSKGETLLTTLMLLRLPFFSTTKPTMTRPCSLCADAMAGYFTFSLRYIISAIFPPGNSGSSSQTSKIESFSTLFSHLTAAVLLVFCARATVVMFQAMSQAAATMLKNNFFCMVLLV